MGTGTGLESHTCEMSNKPKTIFFWACFDQKPTGLMGRGTAGRVQVRPLLPRGYPCYSLVWVGEWCYGWVRYRTSGPQARSGLGRDYTYEVECRLG